MTLVSSIWVSGVRHAIEINRINFFVSRIEKIFIKSWNRTQIWLVMMVIVKMEVNVSGSSETVNIFYLTLFFVKYTWLMGWPKIFIISFHTIQLNWTFANISKQEELKKNTNYKYDLIYITYKMQILFTPLRERPF